MRFFDIVSHKGLLPATAENAILFDASEIAEELDKIETPIGRKAIPRESYGVCAPPFSDRYFWIESITVPSADNWGPGDIAELEASGLGFGPDVLDQFEEIFGETEVRRGALCIARQWGDSPSYEEYISAEGGDRYPGGRWVIEIQAYNQVDTGEGPFGSEIVKPPAIARVVIAQDGTLASDPGDTLVEIFDPDPSSHKLHARAVTNTIPFTLLALSFLHRRTEVEHIRPNRLERKRAARAMGKKRGAAKLRDYYLVRVRPHYEGEEPLTDPSGIRPVRDPDRAGRRAHAVRGHFRRVPDTGLFGRGYHAGELIWIPDHMRGARDVGKVEKGYRISRE
jgi:hypothetical protein